MDILLDSGLAWWITIIEIPALSLLFWMIWRARKDAQNSITHMRETLDVRSHQFREALASFKLEVAKGYASVGELKDLETRIISHLLRIESKLDSTALKTEALRGQHND